LGGWLLYFSPLGRHLRAELKEDRMADDAFVLEIPEMVGIALSPQRTP
jgi:hypothetical protein